ncbi:MAG: hypothetical protein N3D11_10685 [Candidatus Sumerlaeia bacterium]|nr:hypothetical protein [Candidatus Sumerlaeia bacterium]
MNHATHDHVLCGCSRRGFLAAAAGAPALAPSILGALRGKKKPAESRRIEPCGPASKYTPTVHLAFVRRKGDYGIRWPGAVYDGATALKTYRAGLEKAAANLGIKLAVRPQPIYSADEAAQWTAEAQAAKPDGLFVVLLDRQEHSWPTATQAAATGIPTVVFAPIGAAFTTNTAAFAKKTGTFVASTDDFSQAVYGLKMLKAGAKLRETRFIVIRGKERQDTEVNHLGTKLRYIPEPSFLEEYNKLPVNDEVLAIAAEYIHGARKKMTLGATEQDVINGVKSYIVARNILEREQGDAITMNCLGALGKSTVSLPCIAWSRMLDHGIPAACEADIGASVTHALVQYLFDRPGFQQDPVADTSKEALVGAHCTCPTRLNGFDQEPEPYYLTHHHGMRDAVPRPIWKVGQRATVAIIGGLNNPKLPPHMIISAGTVLDNVAVPPSGGCVVSVTLKLDGVESYLDYPGFHQIFFYGDYKKQLREYCQLFGLEARVV